MVVILLNQTHVIVKLIRGFVGYVVILILINIINEAKLKQIMKKVQGNDSFQRINYLYQISKHIVKINPALSSYYGYLMVNVAKKNVLKMHPDIKRQMCKKCRCILINGQTCTTRIKSKHKQKTVVWTCNTCKTQKSLLAQNNKKPLWLEREEAVVEVIN